ncbi:MAG: Sea42 [Caudoviricetes sp.]|nr:MAG: Sea42 [Caudoviricetes sp.]
MTMTKLIALEDFNTAKHCFYIPGNPYVESGAFLCSDGKHYSPSMKTLDTLQKDNPNIRLMLWDDAMEQIENLNTERLSKIDEITEEQWNEMLNILPPMDWQAYRGAQSFLLPEPYTGSWYPCYVTANGKYYKGYSNIRNENFEKRIERFLGK